MLKVEHMTLRFGELIANNDVSLEIPDHKVVAMIGPNGAGKTTCFNCISGVYNADTGSIELNGKSSSFRRNRSMRPRHCLHWERK